MISIGVLPAPDCAPSGEIVDDDGDAFAVVRMDGEHVGQHLSLNLAQLSRGQQAEYLHQLADVARQLAHQISEGGR